ncbi:MAG: SUMF1/EgtB/PvdO family nonheme iron enzyme [Verrucomicrobiae bacterium]|nr:SUMF1/EgtB/PvdO family nonheme iron enzyme [Verrucomicrobiae bacterium]
MKSLCLFLSLLLSTLAVAIQPSSTAVPNLTIGQKKAKAAGLLKIALVPVTDAGNLADTNPLSAGRGAVAQNFQMGTYDVKASEYCQFLNAVASKSDHFALYNEKMNSNPNVASISRTAEADGSFTYSTKMAASELPIAYASWFAAARFCNWMHNGQLIGNEDATTTETGAYTLNGAMKDENETATVAKSDYCNLSDGAKFFLPTEDQWYKAAYYKRTRTGDYWNYPTKSDTTSSNQKGYHNAANYFIASNSDDSKIFPLYWNYQFSNGGKAPFLTTVGTFRQSAGPYGTFDMGGDLFQWVCNPGYAGTRVIRGGSWKKQQNDELKRTTCITANPAIGYEFVGFRIAAPAQ